MKKAALILAIIFVVVTLIVFWKLGRSGPRTAAELLPSTTIALIEAPDLPATLAHWNESVLSKLSKEPEVVAFLQRPLGRLYETSGWLSNTMSLAAATDLLSKIQPGRFFAALEAQEKGSCWIAGCQFFGKSKCMEEGLYRMTQGLDTRLGTSTETLLNAQEHHGELIKKRTYPSCVLYSAIHGHWFFVSNDLSALQTTLDLSTHSLLRDSKAGQPQALEKLALYEKNRHHLFLQGDLFCYLREHPNIESIPYISSLLEEEELLKLAQASGASFRFTEKGLEERLFFNGNFNIQESISHQGMKLTDPTTLGFIERLTGWKEVLEKLKTTRSISPALASLLGNVNLNLVGLADFLKPEMMFSIDWLASSTLPTLLLAAPEDNSEKSANWLDQAARELGTSLQASDQNDLLLFSMSKIAPSIEPSFASANGLFFISSHASTIIQKSNRSPAMPTLENNADFSKNKSLYDATNEAFFYFDSKEIFTRIYSLLRPSLLLGGNMFPQAKGMIDFSRLPSTALVRKYLTPIVIAQSHEQDGFLVQSSGPLCATPLYFLGKILYQYFALKKETFANAT